MRLADAAPEHQQYCREQAERDTADGWYAGDAIGPAHSDEQVQS
jgi:hypothetical protein